MTHRRRRWKAPAPVVGLTGLWSTSLHCSFSWSHWLDQTMAFSHPIWLAHASWHVQLFTELDLAPCFPLWFIYFIIIMTNVPAQLAGGRMYKVHVLGSTPGVLLLHFSDILYRFQCVTPYEVHHETSRSNHQTHQLARI